MNELIEKLAKQAFGSTIDTDPILVYEAEKFAELIVKECAYLVSHQQRTTGYTAHVEMLCREFGVEFKPEDYFRVEE